MKLATLKSNGRDGRLIVVSRDLQMAVAASEIAPTLQSVLDDWEHKLPKLMQLSTALNLRKAADSFPFDPSRCAAPLPRAYQFADASAYVHHVELSRRSRGAELAESHWTEPLLYQVGSDNLLGACDPIVVQHEEWGIDLEGEVAVITGDVPMACQTDYASTRIRLLALVNDISLRNLIPAELSKGYGFFQSKPASAFSPVAVTPDELGDAWNGGKVRLPLVVHINGQLFGKPNAGDDMTFDFAQLIAHASRTRRLEAGSIIAAGPVSNVDRSRGCACIAEKRMLEKIDSGKAATPFLRFGDRVRIEMFDIDGNSVFGAIDQEVARYTGTTR
jgi:fumarylacetoacetate (FAA) hydrolase